MSISSGWAERMPWQQSDAAAPASDAERDTEGASPPAGDPTGAPRVVADAIDPEAAEVPPTEIGPAMVPPAVNGGPAAAWPETDDAVNAVADALPETIEPATAERWASQATTPDGRREALDEIGVHMSEEYAQRAGLDIDPAGVDASVRALATDEGRAAAMRELGVHMSGHLAERYGVEDAEAARLLDASRALRTPEGRRALMAEYTDGADSDLMRYLTGRGDSIGDRREAVQKLLSNDRVRTGAARIGKGLLVGAIVLIVVLVGILIGAVALLGSLFDGGAEATAQLATRPTVEWIGAGLTGRVM